MRGSYAKLLFILGLLSVGTTIGFSLSMHNSKFKCIEKERQALFQFKQGLQGDRHILSSWSSQEDCCRWEGITCSNQTGHVVALDLGCYDRRLEGEISPSLLGLQHLTYLDLSYCNFTNKPLPKFVGSLTKLRYLNLSITNINGPIPQQLGNLTHLISLDLGWNDLMEDHNLDWLLQMSSLRYLHMTGVNLCKVTNWPEKVSMLPAINELNLRWCELSMPIFPQLPNINSSLPLSTLNLHGNYLNSSIFPWLLKYNSTLVSLDLSCNNLQGHVLKAFRNLHNLQVLDLTENEICGEIIDLSELSSLRELHLSKNKLNGILAEVLQKLSTLKVLDVALNSLEGDLIEAHLSNFSTLRHLDLSYNYLSLSFSPTWVPPFHLETIRLGSCKMGIAFPQWLHTQKKISVLDMSNLGILDNIPNWFWDLSSNIEFLNLSHNQISGIIPFQWLLRFIDGSMVDLSYNYFNGQLPQLNPRLSIVVLSNNLFNGSITCPKNESELDLLLAIDLSCNLLSGELPKCLVNFSGLYILNLEENNFSGRITNVIERMCSHSFMNALYLKRNNFSGKLPPIMNCTLQLLDLGENRLSGTIPIFKKACLLAFLSLQSNLFSGSIPLQLCNLELLQVLDLSQNKITGSIPKCLDKFTILAQSSFTNDQVFGFYLSLNDYIFHYQDYISVILKDLRLKFSTTIGLLKVIDLSNNELKGEIPTEITSLLGLIGLNLSGNLLTGMIPERIGDMKVLESLDLLRNYLSGDIPQSLATLTFLNHINLSNNNFLGRIPTSTQLQSFNASAYECNPYLCGLPLMKRCQEDEMPPGSQISGKHGQGNTQDQVNFYRHLGFYSSIVVGFIVGFWGVCGMLLLKSSWRYAYFQRLDHIEDKFYVTIAILKAKLLRNFKTRC